MDARDDRHRARVDRLEHVGKGHRVLLVLLAPERLCRAHPRDVGAGTERPSLAGQDDGPECPRRLTREGRERCPQLGDERSVHRVVDVGPGDRDARNHVRRSTSIDAQDRAHSIIVPGRVRAFARFRADTATLAS